MKKNNDKILKQWWAERRKSTDPDALHQRILRAVEADRFEEHPAPAERPVPARWLPRIGYALAGAAALYLVLLAGPWLDGGKRLSSEESLLSLARFEPRELAAAARMFKETEQLFENRLMWIAESNQDVGLGIDSCPEGRVEDTPPAYVRVMVLERSSDREGWKNVWKTDVIVRGQEWAQVATNGDGKNRMLLWVYPLQDGQLLVDTDLALDGLRSLALRESAVLAPGEPVVVASGRRGETEYRVLQTVEPLNLPGGAG